MSELEKLKAENAELESKLEKLNNANREYAVPIGFVRLMDSRVSGLRKQLDNKIGSEDVRAQVASEIVNQARVFQASALGVTILLFVLVLVGGWFMGSGALEELNELALQKAEAVAEEQAKRRVDELQGQIRDLSKGLEDRVVRGEERITNARERIEEVIKKSKEVSANLERLDTVTSGNAGRLEERLFATERAAARLKVVDGEVSKIVENARSAEKLLTGEVKAIREAIQGDPQVQALVGKITREATEERLKELQKFQDRFEKSAVEAAEARASGCQPGMIMAWPRLSTKPGDRWLPCDGSTISPASWPLLAEHLVGERLPFGGTNGNPRIPDLSGLFLRGLDPKRQRDTEDRSLGHVQEDALQDHGHDSPDHDHSYQKPVDGSGTGSSHGDVRSSAQARTARASPVVGKANTLPGAAQIRTAAETRPDNMAMTFYIYAGPPPSR